MVTATFVLLYITHSNGSTRYDGYEVRMSNMLKREGRLEEVGERCALLTAFGGVSNVHGSTCFRQPSAVSRMYTRICASDDIDMTSYDMVRKGHVTCRNISPYRLSSDVRHREQAGLLSPGQAALRC